MITPSSGVLVIAVGVLGSLVLLADGPLPVPPTPAPRAAFTPAGAPGVKTNRTQLFSQFPQPNPVLPRGLFPPVPPTPARTAPIQSGTGIPAPLADVPSPVVPPRPVTASPSPYTTPGIANPYVPPAIPKPPTQPASYIAWDAESKEYSAKAGESSAHFTFYLTNVSKEVVLVNSVRTSCGCTVAQLPEQPWRLAPGTNGPINVTVNLAGKSGTIVKSVTADTSAGVKSLLVKVNIPAASGQPAVASGVDVDRMRNMQMAMADRQVVFKGDCAKCHSQPAVGKVGGELYTAACGICHDSANRAALVPDLKALKHPTNAEHWKKWIVSGKPNSMMPAFSKSEGGPLDDPQIESLVKYLTETIPSVSPATAGSLIRPSNQTPLPLGANATAPKVQ